MNSNSDDPVRILCRTPQVGVLNGCVYYTNGRFHLDYSDGTYDNPDGDIPFWKIEVVDGEERLFTKQFGHENYFDRTTDEGWDNDLELLKRALVGHIFEEIALMGEEDGSVTKTNI